LSKERPAERFRWIAVVYDEIESAHHGWNGVSLGGSRLVSSHYDGALSSLVIAWDIDLSRRDEQVLMGILIRYGGVERMWLKHNSKYLRYIYLVLT
jgi:hypothetical protein